MYLQRAVRQAFRLGLLVTLVLLALGACGGGGEEEQADKPRPLPENEKVLRPGHYRSEEFKPSFSFRLGEGWSTTALPEMSDALLITWARETGELGFANIQEVYKPTKTGTPKVVDAPESLVGWFEHHPYLQTSKRKAITVGGVKGEQFDVVVGDLPGDYYGECGSDCVFLFRIGGAQPISLGGGDKARFIVLEDMTGETVLMGFDSPATEFDEHGPEAQKVFDSVEWTGS
jgi:hypothetical protein